MSIKQTREETQCSGEKKRKREGERVEKLLSEGKRRRIAERGNSRS